MTPNDEPFEEGELDPQLDALTQGANQSPTTPMSRAYRSLSQLYAPQAAREAEAIERVRQRLAAHAVTPATMPSTQPPRASSERELESVIVPDAPDTLAWRQPQAVRRVSRRRTFMSSVAALLAVGFLLGGFLAILRPGPLSPGSAPLTSYHWRRIPSPNSPLAVNALTGITMRTSTDAWAWGTMNVAPTNANSNPIVMPLIEHWDGSQWRIVATPPPPEGGQLTDIVALAADNAWAVGQQLTGGAENTSNAPLVEHWDGLQWSLVPDNVSDWPNASSLIQVAALSADDIWAVGEGGGDTQSGLIQHWNGRSWQTIAHPSPPGSERFSAITALASNDIWVVGTGAKVFEHWDGSRWTVVPGPSPSGFGLHSSHSVLSAISAVAANDVWAAGLESPVIPFPNRVVPLFEHWDGQHWSIVASPSVTATVSNIVALGPDDVWAVGTMGVGGDVAQQGQGLIEHWDGQRWSLVANPSPQPFTSLGGVALDPSIPGKVWIAGTTGPALNGPDQLTDTKTLIETTP